MAQSYSLTIYNNSTYTGQVVVYQGKPDSNLPADNIKTLAWLSLGIEGREKKIINSVEFKWSIDYGFVWSREGILVPGVQFKASGGAPVESISPPQNNRITFTKGSQNYKFTNQVNGTQGQIEIDTSSDVVPGQSSIGVSMSGAGVFAVEARPSFKNWFIPHPSYTVALGTYRQGAVIDISQLSALNSFEFFGGATDLTFTYQDDGTWTEGPPATLTQFASSKALRNEVRISAGGNTIWPAGDLVDTLILENRHNVAGNIQYRIGNQPIVTVPVVTYQGNSDDDIVITNINGLQLQVWNNLPNSIYATWD